MCLIESCIWLETQTTAIGFLGIRAHISAVLLVTTSRKLSRVTEAAINDDSVYLW